MTRLVTRLLRYTPIDPEAGIGLEQGNISSHPPKGRAYQDAAHLAGHSTEDFHRYHQSILVSGTIEGLIRHLATTTSNGTRKACAHLVEYLYKHQINICCNKHHDGRALTRNIWRLSKGRQIKQRHQVPRRCIILGLVLGFRANCVNMPPGRSPQCLVGQCHAKPATSSS